MASASDRRFALAPALGFGALNLASASILSVGVFGGLPDRYWPVDGTALVVIVLLAVSGVGLGMRARWSIPWAKLASGASLAVGLVLVCALAVTTSYLAGIYGPIGRGGSIIFALVLALALPYLVAIPIAELVWLGRAARPEGGRPADPQ